MASEATLAARSLLIESFNAKGFHLDHQINSFLPQFYLFMHHIYLTFFFHIHFGIKKTNFVGNELYLIALK